MRPLFILIILCFISSLNLTAQSSKYLNGYWKGYITKNSLSETTGLSFELYLEVQGSTIKGRSYVFEEDGTVTEMEISGYIHKDRSISLGDARFLPLGEKELPPYVKQYQFIHNRSIFDTENVLNGYWQEIVETPLSLVRRRGKCVLRKVEVKGKA